ncbi:MAG: hypothetical protein M3P49_16330, partial [Actinomycetota bacterium]|nr:hypothetical protein [Actinomycetota bacterium]
CLSYRKKLANLYTNPNVGGREKGEIGTIDGSLAAAKACYYARDGGKRGAKFRSNRRTFPGKSGASL